MQKLPNQFEIDLVGGCNLSCPTCPVGNSDYGAAPKGYMKPELLEQILIKAKSECGAPTVALYNWTEPFLHPQLAKMISIVKSHGLVCALSTNLNIAKKLDDVVAAGPDSIFISLSAFHQENYRKTHVGGNIETVKANMRALADSIRRQNATIAVDVRFHRYLHNAEDEALMRAYSESLGFSFSPLWAFFMPMEKVLEYVEPGSMGVSITTEDHEAIDRLALPLKAGMELSRVLGKTSCMLRDDQVVLTSRGEAQLCCATYDQKRFGVGNYLDVPLDEIQKRRNEHAACSTCIKNGYNSFAVYQPRKKLDELAYDFVSQVNPSGVHPRAKKGAMYRRLAPLAHVVRDHVRRVRGIVFPKRRINNS